MHEKSNQLTLQLQDPCLVNSVPSSHLPTAVPLAPVRLNTL